MVVDRCENCSVRGSLKSKPIGLDVLLEPDGYKRFNCIYCKKFVRFYCPQRREEKTPSLSLYVLQIGNKPTGYFSELLKLCLCPSQAWYMPISTGFILCICTSLSETLKVSERERSFCQQGRRELPAAEGIRCSGR